MIHTSSYVTTLTEESSDVIPLIFRGKEIETTLVHTQTRWFLTKNVRKLFKLSYISDIFSQRNHSYRIQHWSSNSNPTATTTSTTTTTSIATSAPGQFVWKCFTRSSQPSRQSCNEDSLKIFWEGRLILDPWFCSYFRVKENPNLHNVEEWLISLGWATWYWIQG